MIISAILGLIIYHNFLFGGSLSFNEQSVINMSLSMGILICFLWGYRVPTQITLNVFDYWFVIFPLAFIILLYGVILGYEQIAINLEMKDFVPYSKDFKIGLGIAAMTSIGAIMVLLNADRRLRRIERGTLNGNVENVLSDFIKQEVKRQVELELSKSNKEKR